MGHIHFKIYLLTSIEPQYGVFCMNNKVSAHIYFEDIGLKILGKEQDALLGPFWKVWLMKTQIYH